MPNVLGDYCMFFIFDSGLQHGFGGHFADKVRNSFECLLSKAKQKAAVSREAWAISVLASPTASVYMVVDRTRSAIICIVVRLIYTGEFRERGTILSVFNYLHNFIEPYETKLYNKCGIWRLAKHILRGPSLVTGLTGRLYVLYQPSDRYSSISFCLLVLSEVASRQYKSSRRKC